MNDDLPGSSLPDDASNAYPRGMKFEWDSAKAASNLAKHGVSFEEASSVFGDWLHATGRDDAHSTTEDRYITMGMSASGRVLLVSHTDRGDAIRIISARVADRHQRKDYEDGNFP